MSATIVKPTYPKLTPEEFQELLQRERAKGNPLALFVGSGIDPNDPEDKDYWQAIHEERDRMEQQLCEMEERDISPSDESQITSTPSTKLTPEELEALIQRERAKGNPWAIFAGSCYDPNDPEDKIFWEGVRECRREMEEQQARMDALAEKEAAT